MLFTKHVSKALALTFALSLAGCTDAPTSVLDAQPSLLSERQLFLRDPLRDSRPHARLVPCGWSPTVTTTAVVGKAGGTLSIADHQITIPAGAVAAPTTFTATIPAGRHLVVRLQALDLPTTGLARAATVRISYAQCRRQDLRRRALGVLALNGPGGPETASAPISDVQSTNDWLALVLEFAIVQMGTYGVSH